MYPIKAVLGLSILALQITVSFLTIVTDNKSLAKSQVFIFYKFNNTLEPDCYGTLISLEHVLIPMSCVIYVDNSGIPLLIPYLSTTIVSWVKQPYHDLLTVYIIKLYKIKCRGSSIPRLQRNLTVCSLGVIEVIVHSLYTL